MAEARPIEGYDPVFFAGHGNEAARAEVLYHTAVAVQKDERFAFAMLDVMKSHTMNIDKPSSGRVIPFCFLCQITIDQGGRSQ
jgi:hypothetical protein